jgi:hypothetical protein
MAGGAWVFDSLDKARYQLNDAIWQRVLEDPPGQGVERVRFPMAFLFIRGDRAGAGRDLADQVVSSFGYWNADSGRYFDVIFPGWGNLGDEIVFDQEAFLAFRGEIEEISKWRYSGQTDLLLAHYDYFLERERGDFAFDQSIYLPVEQMVRDGRIANLDALMAELVEEAKKTWPHAGKDVVWQIAGRMALHRGGTATWEWIKSRLLKDAGKIYDQVQPFVVADLRPPGHARRDSDSNLLIRSYRRAAAYVRKIRSSVHADGH